MRARPNLEGLTSTSMSSVVEAMATRFLCTHPEGLIGAKASVNDAVAAKMNDVANFIWRVDMVAGGNVCSRLFL